LFSSNFQYEEGRRGGRKEGKKIREEGRTEGREGGGREGRKGGRQGGEMKKFPAPSCDRPAAKRGRKKA
jgi:hypothetical protein